MLSREFCIALLSDHDDLVEGGPLDLAYDAVVAVLGWDAFTDEALSMMASEILRVSGLMPDADPVTTILMTSPRRH
jgi:hypothetical protein